MPFKAVRVCFIWAVASMTLVFAAVLVAGCAGHSASNASGTSYSVEPSPAAVDLRHDNAASTTDALYAHASSAPETPTSGVESSAHAFAHGQAHRESIAHDHGDGVLNLHHANDGADHAHGDHDHAMAHATFDPAAACRCETARNHHGWCARCNVGYIAGVKVESARLFNTLDAHGHTLDLRVFTAEACKNAIANNEFCAPCRMGYVNGQAYFTRLTHGLARGVVVQKESLRCATCAGFVGGEGGWCSSCNRGIIGNVMWIDRSMYEATLPEFVIFTKANDGRIKCEWCVAAMVLHSSCVVCRIDYP